MSTDEIPHRITESQPADYPFMWAMANAIFLLFAIGAVLDPQPQEFLAKVTGSAALLITGLKHGRGLRPVFSVKARVFTAVLVVLDVVLFALIWTVR